MEYELRCINNSRKSFYGKARVREEEGKTILISYDTEVAYIENGKPIIKGMYSYTTARHIREFLAQHGFDTEMPFSRLEKLYSLSDEQKQENQKLEEEKATNMFRSVKAFAGLSEVFCSTQKDKNDWKARMLKAGLESEGLIMPDDWEQLSESEKENRLNNVLVELGRE